MKKHFFLLLAFSLVPTSTSQCMDPEKERSKEKWLPVIQVVITFGLLYGAYRWYYKDNPTPMPTPPQNPTEQQPASQQPNTVQTNEPAIPQSILEDIKKEVNLHEEQQKPAEQPQAEEKKSILTETKPADAQPILNQPNITHVEKKPQQCSGQQCSIKKSSNEEICEFCHVLRQKVDKTLKRHFEFPES